VKPPARKWSYEVWRQLVSRGCSKQTAVSHHSSLRQTKIIHLVGRLVAMNLVPNLSKLSIGVPATQDDPLEIELEGKSLVADPAKRGPLLTSDQLAGTWRGNGCLLSPTCIRIQISPACNGGICTLPTLERWLLDSHPLNPTTRVRSLCDRRSAVLRSVSHSISGPIHVELRASRRLNLTASCVTWQPCPLLVAPLQAQTLI